MSLLDLPPLLLAAALGASAAAGAAVPSRVIESECQIVYETAEGKPVLAPGPSVLVETQREGPFHLAPSDRGRPVALRCFRSDVVPEPNDYKVGLGGYPLFIASEDNSRIVRVQVTEQGFEIVIIKGALSAAEEKWVKLRVAEFNVHLAKARQG